MKNLKKLLKTKRNKNKLVDKIKKDYSDRMWKRANNYIGHNFYDHIILASTHRDDICCINSSNIEYLNDIFKDNLIVERASHWACGWVEFYMIDLNNVKVNILNKVIDVLKNLDDYPVLDDGIYYEHKHNRLEEIFDQTHYDRINYLREKLDIDYLDLNKEEKQDYDYFCEIAIGSIECHCGIEEAWFYDSEVKDYLNYNDIEFKTDLVNNLIKKIA